jgi:hypothetical protein
LDPFIFIKAFFVLATQILSISPEKNTAYLDPGSGSFIFQLIIASLVGGAFIVKTYWKRISGYVHRLFSKNPKDGEE